MKRFLSASLLILLLISLVFSNAEEYKLLKLNSSGSEVTRLQERLIELGLYSGKVNGKYGENTQSAVKRFQRAMLNSGQKISVDGMAGSVTQGFLYDDEACKSLLEIRLYDKGERVRRLQNRLYDLNFLNIKGDGDFGKNTESALQNFQQVLMSHNYPNIKVTGIADEATRIALSDDKLNEFGIIAPEFFDDEKPLSLTSDFIYARHAILMDGEGNILFEKNANTRAYPASLTKMMTLLLSLEKGDLDKKVKLTEAMTKLPESSSLVPFKQGEVVTRELLMYGLMLRSGNEAANALAISTKVTIPKFVELMNERAKALQMKGTQFKNAHGFHNKEHYTTAKDMLYLAVELMKNEKAREIVSTVVYTLPASNMHKERQIKNSADILQPDSPYYYEYAHGIKTGFTTPAGNCFASYAQKDGKTLYSIVLDCRTRNMTWEDTRRLFEYGFNLTP